jgi:hypothetical protein
VDKKKSYATSLLAQLQCNASVGCSCFYGK